ncbi:MAG: HD domain-containing protein [Deltaproteobacteria bacterium]|nr:HD domain-containing protein [Deltaproteobacteria bacterium]
MTNEETREPFSASDHLWVRDIKEDTPVKDVYMVKVKKAGQTKAGAAFLSLTLADKTGDIEARVWDNAEELSSRFKEGDIIAVSGKALLYRNQVQLTLTGITPSSCDDPGIFLESTPHDTSAMIKELKGIVRAIKNPDLRDLINAFLSDHLFLERFRQAPAAKNFHHGYIGGLLEHTLSVCRMAKQVCAQYPELDADLVITGAFLHDIGKTREFTSGKILDYTDEGRLIGHLVLGVSMLDEKLAALKRFPPDTALCLRHMILSHHGEYEFGSPKRPKFPEAFVLHFVDDLDAKVNGIARIIAKDKTEGQWTEFNRMFERYFLKERAMPREEEPVARPLHQDRQGKLF